MTDENCKTRDLTRGWSAVVLFCLPVAALMVGSYDQKTALLLWIPALVVMGVACLANAARCGRVHCYVTGPLLLIAAVYVVLWGFHLVPMHPAVFLDSILGIAVLACLAEIPLGRYRKNS